MATYSLVIRRLMICSVTIVVSRAMTSPLLALLLSTRLGLDQQDIGLLMGVALFIAGLIGFSLADGLLGWCVAMFVFTLGEMIIYPSEFLFIDTIAPDALRGSYYGAQNLAAFGGAMSPVICGYLLINAAPTSMFYALGALTALGGTLCFLSGRRVAGSC